jgi:hypothetical protein
MIRRTIIAGLLLTPGAVAAANRIAGPVTCAIALLGLVIAGPALVLAPRVDGFARGAIRLVFVVALILLTANLFSLLATVGASVLRPSRATPEAVLPARPIEPGDN